MSSMFPPFIPKGRSAGHVGAMQKKREAINATAVRISERTQNAEHRLIVNIVEGFDSGPHDTEDEHAEQMKDLQSLISFTR